MRMHATYSFCPFLAGFMVGILLSIAKLATHKAKMESLNVEKNEKQPERSGRRAH